MRLRRTYEYEALAGLAGLAAVVGLLASCGGIIRAEERDDDGGGDAVSASSSGSGSGGGGGGSSRGSRSGGDIDAGTDDATMGGDDSSSSTDCGVIPTLHPQPAGTLYCGIGADAAALLCPIGQECCLGGALGGGQYAPQECAVFGGTCPNVGPAGPTIPVECNQVSDCLANGIAGPVSCCLQGSTPPAEVPGCPYPKAKNGTAIVCETNAQCASGEVQICASQADCPTGTTCTPGKWKIFQNGFCL